MRRRFFPYLISSTLSLAVLLSGAAPAGAHGTTSESSSEPFSAPDKSIAFYVGGDLTEDGHPMLGGFGHEPSSHWVEIVPAQEHQEDATITVGATEDADLPGELTEIPQTEETYRYITSNYSEVAGVRTPLMYGGIDAQNVAASDVWADSRQALGDMTPAQMT